MLGVDGRPEMMGIREEQDAEESKQSRHQDLIDTVSIRSAIIM